MLLVYGVIAEQALVKTVNHSISRDRAEVLAYGQQIQQWHQQTTELIANQAKVQKVQIVLPSHQEPILVPGVSGLLTIVTDTFEDKIFDPFHSSSPVGQGTGLGLSICYSIIQQHLGSIQAESRHAEGANDYGHFVVAVS